MFMIILLDFALMDSVQCILMVNIPLFQGKLKQGKGREFKLYRLDPSGKVWYTHLSVKDALKLVNKSTNCAYKVSYKIIA